jgi:Tfp pilus assembly protein PilO
MRRSFKEIWPPKDLVSGMWLAAAALLVANLVALIFVLRPPGGSAEELRSQAAELRAQVRQRQAALTRTRDIAGKVETGRTDEDRFMNGYFLDSRTLASTIVSEVVEAAKDAGLHQKETSNAIEPVEGSDDLGMVTISANFDGSYANLMKLLNVIDRSSRLMIIESLAATPQQGSSTLNINLRLNGFVRENAGGPLPLPKADENSPAKTAQNVAPGGQAE